MKRNQQKYLSWYRRICFNSNMQTMVNNLEKKTFIPSLNVIVYAFNKNTK